MRRFIAAVAAAVALATLFQLSLTAAPAAAGHEEWYRFRVPINDEEPRWFDLCHHEVAATVTGMEMHFLRYSNGIRDASNRSYTTLMGWAGHGHEVRIQPYNEYVTHGTTHGYLWIYVARDVLMDDSHAVASWWAVLVIRDDEIIVERVGESCPG